jgi:aminopeptidase N
LKNCLPTFISFLFILLNACASPDEKLNSKITKIDLMPIDHHSYAKPNEARIIHLDLIVEVSFEDKLLNCTAKYKISKSASASELLLDTKGINVSSVFINDSIEVKNYRFSEPDPILGSALHIPIIGEVENVSINYQSSNDAAALQWLSPQQTQGQQPFLFTQSQAILCRSWIPIQDSPGIKFTYNATVKVPPGFLALMSATNPQKLDSTGVYQFEMTQPIPAYLMALAVGDIEFHKYDSISGVYAEPLTLASASEELEDLNLMVAAAEKLYGKYQWGRFDVLMLPPSFPFGGMENPKLTFATPTILAGDKSLTSLIAHELAHSWSGNLVTNATWEDFWLNEGFTVYFEYRIMEEVFGKPFADMLSLISKRELEMEVAEMLLNGQENDTKLKLNLEGRDPDDGLTAVAYDKGYFFLKRLEEIAGREYFDSFLKGYFKEFAFRTMTTESFIIYAEQHLFIKNHITYPEQLFNSWIYGQGLPDDMPIVSSSLFESVEVTLKSWLREKDNSILPDSTWGTHEWLHFMHELPDTITVNELVLLDSKMNFTLSNNKEIQAEWYLLGLQYSYKKMLPYLEEFLVNTGRRKFLIPLYVELIKYDKQLAVAIYKKARPNYHFVSYNSLDKLFESAKR